MLKANTLDVPLTGKSFSRLVRELKREHVQMYGYWFQRPKPKILYLTLSFIGLPSGEPLSVADPLIAHVIVGSVAFAMSRTPLPYLKAKEVL
jgi:hypothetical protein